MVCNSVRDLYESYDSFLLDMYGVLYNGSCLYDGVLDLLSNMKNAGKIIVILSNTTIVSNISMKRYEKWGLFHRKHYDDFITSGDVFSKTLREDFSGAAYHQIFSPNTELFSKAGLIESNSIKDADFIYVGIPLCNGVQVNLNNLVDLQDFPISVDSLFNIDWANLRQLRGISETLDQCLKYNKKLFVANPDVFAIERIEGEDSPVLCQGAIGEYYENMGGEVLYFGKPYSPVYDYAKKFVKGKSVMVGDTPWTDVLGGNMAHMDTILTLTGVSESFMKKMPHETSMSDCIRLLLTDVSDRMTHKNLRGFSRIPTHIVKEFAELSQEKSR